MIRFDFAVFFDVCRVLSAPYAFLQGLNLGLHIARPVDI